MNRDSSNKSEIEKWKTLTLANNLQIFFVPQRAMNSDINKITFGILLFAYNFIK